MAVRCVDAVASHGKARLMRQGGERRDQVPCVRLTHLLQVGPRKLLPPSGRPRLAQSRRNDIGTRRELRQPDVIEVALRKLRLGNATRRPAHSSESQSFADTARRAKSYNTY